MLGFPKDYCFIIPRTQFPTTYFHVQQTGANEPRSIYLRRHGLALGPTFPLPVLAPMQPTTQKRLCEVYTVRARIIEPHVKTLELPLLVRSGSFFSFFSVLSPGPRGSVFAVPSSPYPGEGTSDVLAGGSTIRVPTVGRASECQYIHLSSVTRESKGKGVVKASK